MTDNLQYAIFHREALREQLRQSIWTEAERAELSLNLRIVEADTETIKTALVDDGFSPDLVDDLERQYICEYMEGIIR